MRVLHGGQGAAARGWAMCGPFKGGEATVGAAGVRRVVWRAQVVGVGVALVEEAVARVKSAIGSAERRGASAGDGLFASSIVAIEGFAEASAFERACSRVVAHGLIFVGEGGAVDGQLGSWSCGLACGDGLGGDGGRRQRLCVPWLVLSLARGAVAA